MNSIRLGTCLLTLMIILGPVILRGNPNESHISTTYRVSPEFAYSQARQAMKEEGWRDITHEVTRGDDASVGPLYGRKDSYFLRPEDSLMINITSSSTKTGCVDIYISADSHSKSAAILRDEISDKIKSRLKVLR